LDRLWLRSAMTPVRTAFIMEALTQYLTIAAVIRLLQFMSNAAPGSPASFI
jgi:O-methyltransferase involved in polyketide biosynthesis